MSVYDNSAGRRSAALYAKAQGGLWRRLLIRLRLRAVDARTAREAAAWAAGSAGEERTKQILAELEAYGWKVFHDRRIPGLDRANADHIIVSPGARLFLADSKLWHGNDPVEPRDGRLWHGNVSKDRAVRSLLVEAEMVQRALRTPVQPLIVVHNAPVAGDGFYVRGVPVFPAGRLKMLLALNDGPPSPGALWVAQAVAAKLPPYR